jgi:hypothetical protein
MLRICLLAYPRELRERDGAELNDLALELADDHGIAREGLGLLWGGWRERRRRASRRRRTTIALAAATGAVLAVLTWSAAADPGRVEEDRFGCAGDCAAVQREVADRIDDGWTCTKSAAWAAVTWRCTLD